MILKARDLIPILSFISLRGRCRYCKSSIDKTSSIVEFFSGLLMVAMFARLGCTLTSIGFFVIVMACVPLLVIDLKMKRLPSLWVGVCFFSFICLFAASFLFDSRVFPWISATSTAFTFLVYCSIFWITGTKGIGFGDVKLAPILVGTAGLLGYEQAIAAFMFPYFLAAFALVYFIFVKKMTRKTAVPLGPFLILGFYLAILTPERFLIELFEILALS